jgi:hypothetical protein
LSDAAGFEIDAQAVNGSVCVGRECDVVVPVPEPGALTLLGTGLLALWGVRRRRQGLRQA